MWIVGFPSFSRFVKKHQWSWLFYCIRTDRSMERPTFRIHICIHIHICIRAYGSTTCYTISQCTQRLWNLSLTHVESLHSHTSVIVCTDLSVKEPYIHVGMGTVVKSRWWNVQHTGLECKRCGFNSRSLCNISNFHHTDDTAAMTSVLYKLCAVWLLNLPCVIYICEVNGLSYTYTG